MAAMHKRLAAYQAGAPVVDLDDPVTPQLSVVPRGAMARAVSETSDEAIDARAPKKRGPKVAAQMRKEARGAANAAKKVEALKQAGQRAAGLQSQHLSGLGMYTIHKLA